MGVFLWYRQLLCRQYCVLCHGQAVADGLCAGCMSDLSRLPSVAGVCPRCTRRSTAGTVCGYCQQKPPPFEYLWASVYYEPPVSNMVHAFKYKSDWGMQRSLCELMLHYPPPWLESARIDCVLAMPLSKARRLFRGFNQSDALAEAVGRRYHLPVLPHTTLFRQHRVPQSTQKRSGRRRNVRNVFALNLQRIEGCRILLVDDVVTTGATFEALAQTLKRAGAAAVFCWALAYTRLD